MKLDTLLDTANTLASQLQESLEQEKTALATIDAEQLTASTARKQAMLNALELWESDHHDVITNIDAVIAKAPTTQQLHRQLRDTLQNCQRLNEVNALVGQMSNHSNQRILHILRGQDASLDLYSNKGQSTHQQTSRYDIEA